MITAIAMFYFLFSCHAMLRANSEAKEARKDLIATQKINDHNTAIFNNDQMVLYSINERLEYLIQNHKALSSYAHTYLDAADADPVNLDNHVVSLLQATNKNRESSEALFQKLFKKTYNQYVEEKEFKAFQPTDNRFSMKFSVN